MCMLETQPSSHALGFPSVMYKSVFTVQHESVHCGEHRKDAPENVELKGLKYVNTSWLKVLIESIV